MKIILSFLILFSFHTLKGQNSNDAKFFAYNIGFSAINGGIGAIINKKEDQKTFEAFIKGFTKGSLGGLVVYGSKQLVRENFNNYNRSLLWSTKLVNAVGVSMIENAALNKGLLESFHLDIGFLRLELHPQSESKFKSKFLPLAFAGFVYLSTQSSFNPKYSLQLLTPVFINDDWTKFDIEVEGSIMVKDRAGITNNIHHELIHVFQRKDYLVINTFFKPYKENLEAKHPFIKSINRFIYWDFPGSIINRTLYSLEEININSKWNNFFEDEANHFSSRL